MHSDLWLWHETFAADEKAPLYVTEMLSHHRWTTSLRLADISNDSLQGR